ncbi:uncharacterized protein LOC117892459 [Drosophila subobscura]|uniref:uncharacterized protein LOC117892459 n=1 Tax=Drosophila subobscura TaxID=7241 RepID=UPI00155AB6DE|nr:uncharacterized protein LOC117892459 [Drosophila subobscura]
MLGFCLAVAAATDAAKTKITFLSAEYKYDGNYAEYFGLAPGHTQLLVGNLTKPLQNLFLDIRTANEETQKVIYKFENFPLCRFLDNHLIAQLYARWYDAIVGNTTPIKCPVRPGIYHFQNRLTPSLLPNFHPAGSYRIAIQVKSTNGQGPFIVALAWHYRVIKK